MKNLKTIAIIAIVTLTVLSTIACKKEKTPIDYSKSKINKIQSFRDGTLESTASYTYNEDSIIINILAPPDVSVKSSSRLTANSYSNIYNFSSPGGGINLRREANLNSFGFMDSLTSIAEPGSFISSSSNKFEYNSKGYQTRETTYNPLSRFISTNVYDDNDNIIYTKWVTYNAGSLSPSTLDSFAYEYYLDKNQILELDDLKRLQGKPSKHLIKQNTRYNLITRTLTDVVKYNYELDNNGLVTKKTSMFYNNLGTLTSKREEIVTYDQR